MRKETTIWKLLGEWFVVIFVLGLINMFFIKSSILHSVLMASLGVRLFIRPVWPEELEVKYSEKQCILFIRIVAVLEILLSFMSRMSF